MAVYRFEGIAFKLDLKTNVGIANVTVPCVMKSSFGLL